MQSITDNLRVPVETWAQEMNGGPGTKWGPGQQNSSPRRKLYFNPWILRKLLDNGSHRYDYNPRQKDPLRFVVVR